MKFLSKDSFNDALSRVSPEYATEKQRGVSGFNTLTDTQIDALIFDNKLLTRTIELPVQDAVKYPPDLKGMSVKDEATLLNDYILGQWDIDVFKECGILGRTYGSVYVWLDLDDGRTPDMPVDWENVRDLRGYEILSREECRAVIGRGRFEKITQYYVTRYDLGGSLKVHSDRLLAFHGQRIRGRKFRQNRGHHRSVVAAAIPTHCAYEESLQTALNMLKDYDVFVYKMKGLYDLAEAACTGDDAEHFKADDSLYYRLSSLIEGKSVTRGMVVDAELEDAEFISRNYTGVKEIVQDLRMAFAERVDVPVSLLFNNAQADLFTDAGLSERYLMSHITNSYQMDDFKGNHYKLFRIFASIRRIKKRPTNIEYQPTVQLTAAEKAKLYFDIAKTDQTNILARIYTPRSAARKHAQGSLIIDTHLTTLDVEAAPDDFETGQNTPVEQGQNANGNTSKQGSNTDVSGNHRASTGTGD